MQSSTIGHEMGRVDIVGGILVTLCGLGALVVGKGYGLGSMRTLGPGFFPAVLGIAACLIGVTLIVGGAQNTEHVHLEIRNAIRPLSILLLSILVFALLVTWSGLVPAVVACVAISSFAQSKPTLKRIIGLSIGIVAGCVLIFVYGLGVDIPLVVW